jgi:hypothetical protein
MHFDNRLLNCYAHRLFCDGQTICVQPTISEMIQPKRYRKVQNNKSLLKPKAVSRERERDEKESSIICLREGWRRKYKEEILMAI